MGAGGRGGFYLFPMTPKLASLSPNTVLCISQDEQYPTPPSAPHCNNHLPIFAQAPLFPPPHLIMPES